MLSSWGAYINDGIAAQGNNAVWSVPGTGMPRQKRASVAVKLACPPFTKACCADKVGVRGLEFFGGDILRLIVFIQPGENAFIQANLIQRITGNAVVQHIPDVTNIRSDIPFQFAFLNHPVFQTVNFSCQ